MSVDDWVTVGFFSTLAVLLFLASRRPAQSLPRRHESGGGPGPSPGPSDPD